MSEKTPLACAPWLNAAETRGLFDAFAAAGTPALAVGGCVRDALLDLGADIADLDLASAAPPDRASAIVERAGGKVFELGRAHGSIGAQLGERVFEITTFRRDVETDGRHARVVFAERFEDDAARRDFTINAMACDASGRLLDPLGGRRDLALGRVRFVGEARERVREDRLRALRFFRFFARFGVGAPDREAIAACSAIANELPLLSGERIGAELFKLFGAACPPERLEASLDHMVASGVARALLGVELAPERAARVRALGGDGLLALRAVALDEAALTTLAERLRLSKRDRERLTRPARPAPTGFDPRWLQRHGVGVARDRMLLAAARDGAQIETWRARLAAFDRAAEGWREQALSVSGADAIALGARPGPRVGRALRRVERWWRIGGMTADVERQRAALAAALRKSGEKIN